MPLMHTDKELTSKVIRLERRVVVDELILVEVVVAEALRRFRIRGSLWRGRRYEPETVEDASRLIVEPKGER